MPSGAANPSAQRGFTLLEVLVAFAILGISLGVLLQSFATGLRNTALADDYAQAGMYAESVLAAMGVEAPLSEGNEQGQINERFFWRTQVSVYVEEGLELNDALQVSAYQVVVEVFWQDNGKERSVALQTLRLVGPESQVVSEPRAAPSAAGRDTPLQ